MSSNLLSYTQYLADHKKYGHSTSDTEVPDSHVGVKFPQDVLPGPTHYLSFPSHF